jgi:hypothetical protein
VINEEKEMNDDKAKKGDGMTTKQPNNPYAAKESQDKPMYHKVVELIVEDRETVVQKELAINVLMDRTRKHQVYVQLKIPVEKGEILMAVVYDKFVEFFDLLKGINDSMILMPYDLELASKSKHLIKSIKKMEHIPKVLSQMRHYFQGIHLMEANLAMHLHWI